MFNSIKFLFVLLTYSLWLKQQVVAQFTIDQIRLVANKNNKAYMNESMDNLIIPRVVGTSGHKAAQKYIIKELKDMNFYVEEDDFMDHTPILGDLKFKNIIGYLNPNADKYLALACHYDSKYFPDSNTFEAATDSGVPCSIMLNIVKTTNYALQKINHDINLSLMLIFFDGEEAFEKWSRTDSTYGARHLAEKWAKQNFYTSTGELKKNLDRIEMIMLLDLMGASGQTFHNFFYETSGAQKRLHKIENRLRMMGKLAHEEDHQMFLTEMRESGMEDDHIPFLERGVPILHLIASPFPKVWHTLDDNFENLNYNAIDNVNKVLRVFTLEYLLTCHYKYQPSYCIRS